MDNYKLTKLGEAFDVRDGTHDSPKYVKSGYPLVTSKNLKNGFLDITNVNYITEADYLDICRRSKVDRGDVLFAMIGTIGNPIVIESDANFAIKNVALFKKKDLKDNSKFLAYYLSSPSVIEKMLIEAKGATQKFVGLSYLRNFEIAIPNYKEQNRIVNVLENLFTKIDNSILLLEENLQYSHSLMGSILDEVFTNLEQTSEVVKISKIADIKGGKRLPKGEQLQDKKTDYPYIRVTDFNDNGSIDIDGLKYITKEIQSKISRYIITSDDLYISIAGTIGKTGIIPKELDGANLTENAARFVYKDKKSISNKFVYYYTKSDKFKAFVAEATKQVAQPKLALTRLNEIELALPSIIEQEKAVEKFIKMENTLLKMEKEIQIKLDNMKALKSSLLDQAFKGEL